MLKIIFFCSIALNLLGIQLAASEPIIDAKSPVDFSINRYTKDYNLSFKLGTIKIINHFGDVQVKNTHAHQVGVSVVAQEIGKQPAIHELLINNTKNNFDLTVNYKKTDERLYQEKLVDWPIGRVDLVIFVPINMKVEIITTSGAIGVRKTKNWIKATSDSGTIDIANQYDIEASSNSGRIKVFPMSTNWKKGLNLKSSTSSIYAIIPNSESVKLNIDTNGQIKSRIQSQGEWIQIKSNKYKTSEPNYQIVSQFGDIYVSPHELVNNKKE